MPLAQPDPHIDLSIVIINHRFCEQLKRVLPSIFDKEWKCRFEVIVVNKASDDAAEQFLAENYPQVRLIPVEKFGIASMRNVGITHAQGRHFVMLDSDTEVLDGAFDETVTFMDAHTDVGGAGGKTLRPDGTLEYSAKRFYTPGALLFRRTFLGRLFPNNTFDRLHLMKDKNHDTVFDIDWMAGAFFIMRREAVEQVGLFDDKYYFGLEDVDWCYRAKKRDWRICYIPDAKIVHYVQRSSAKGLNRFALEHLKSGFRFLIKHFIKRS